MSENWAKQLHPAIKQAWDEHVRGLNAITDKLDISDNIKVTVSKDKVTDKYNINISIGREIVASGKLDTAMNLIKHDIELRLAEL